MLDRSNLVLILAYSSHFFAASVTKDENVCESSDLP
jgi:hypothetical protein